MKTWEKLLGFSEMAGVRQDWHEPDEEGVTAEVVGDHLDNAMGDCVEGSCGELIVVLRHNDGPAVELNLANILALATEAARERRLGVADDGPACRFFQS